LTAEQILHWADLHFRRTGKWPKYNIGPVVDAAGESWAAVDSALRYGKRGLPGESSLARMLAEKRGERVERPGEGGHDRTPLPADRGRPL
jgi:hypothetical protein